MSTMALLGFLLQFVLSGFGLLGLVQPPPPNPQEPHWVHDGARLFTPLPADQSHHAERHEPTWPPSGKVEPHAAPDVTVPHAHHEAR